MTLIQHGLRKQAAGRIRAARPDLAARHDLDTYDGLLAAQRDIAAEDTDASALAAVVLRSLDLAQWARDTCAFALGVGPERVAAWRASFTRTVFLAGNPAHLRDRFAFVHLAPDLSAAWTAPGPAAETAGLRRLLKLFDGPAALPARPDTLVEIPGEPRLGSRPSVYRELYVATVDCTVSEALVHVNHVLVEAVLDGLIAPGDRLILRQVPRMAGLPAHLASVRVVTEHQLPGRLKAAAGLTEEAFLA
ncbi:hypothetical protein GCM10012285_50860 [Streptomyces kronopolitis]|uniref:Uncharacterized protein n=1 Tax=Streptomyces kronopolitis TaxID=1612435 RepID=A0ABQ2JUF3_9ACTN|nr:DUF6182 family protein [Streptomyces kronopolitis]GGN56332.1 hypothetical protein GCM10012285_50860 [Streptomyces kronopolitis]